VVADSGFTSRASVAALLRTGVPFVLGLCPHRANPRPTGDAERPAAALVARRRGDPPGRLPLAGTPTDHRGPWVYLTSLRSSGPQRLIARYRRRGRVEQTTDELLNGHDFDHLVSYRLRPNRIAVSFRLLARNLAIGHQLATAEQPAQPIREPRAFRMAHVDGLGTFTVKDGTIILRPLRPMPTQRLRLGWTRLGVRLAA
jgi:hypothetical protein